MTHVSQVQDCLLYITVNSRSVYDASVNLMLKKKKSRSFPKIFFSFHFQSQHFPFLSGGTAMQFVVVF